MVRCLQSLHWKNLLVALMVLKGCPCFRHKSDALKAVYLHCNKNEMKLDEKQKRRNTRSTLIQETAVVLISKVNRKKFFEYLLQ